MVRIAMTMIVAVGVFIAPGVLPDLVPVLVVVVVVIARIRSSRRREG
jgi:hypothetical protein